MVKVTGRMLFLLFVAALNMFIFNSSVFALDTIPPVLNSVAVSKNSVLAGDSLTITVDATDPGSGISAIWVSLISPKKQLDTFNGQSIYFGSPTADLIRTTVIDYPGGIEAGRWKVAISMKDEAGNIQWDYPTNVYVDVTSNTTALDTTPPVLNSVAVSKNSVLAGDSLTITVDATDPGSGISAIWVSLISPKKQLGVSNGQTIYFGSPTADLIRTAVIDYPGGIEAGRWKVAISMKDEAGNIQWAYPINVYVDVHIPINALCGTSNGQSFSSVPSANLCLTGTPTIVTVNENWIWACSGIDGGTNVDCSAKVLAKQGDCDFDGSVTIAEVQSAINMFLGVKAPQTCVDTSSDNTVSIAEVQKVINGFLGL